MEFQHTTVLLHEMIDRILTDPHGIYVDCTLGGGGHSFAMAEKLAPDALLIGVDQDEEAIEAASHRLSGCACRHLFVRDNFSHIHDILTSLTIDKVDGFIFDLGVSSHQLDDGSRGFSYMNNGKLDMRMDQRNPRTAYEIVNTYEEEELARIIWEYGKSDGRSGSRSLSVNSARRSPSRRRMIWSRSSRRPFRRMPEEMARIRRSARFRRSASR